MTRFAFALAALALRVPLPAAAQSEADRLAAQTYTYAHLASAALRDSARARLATLDGQVSLTGLDSVVEVRRDRWGVPHIYARTPHDVLFAQGYVAAQD